MASSITFVHGDTAGAIRLQLLEADPDTPGQTRAKDLTGATLTAQMREQDTNVLLEPEVEISGDPTEGWVELPAAQRSAWTPGAWDLRVLPDYGASGTDVHPSGAVVRTIHILPAWE